MDMESKYKKSVDDIYNTISELHDNEMKRHISGILTLILPHDGDASRGVVQAVFDPDKNKRIDLLRNMYTLFGMMLSTMGIDLADVKRELASSFREEE